MSSPSGRPVLFEGSGSKRHQLIAILIASTLGIAPFVLSPQLARQLLATDFLPHLYCYLSNPLLVWTHVLADAIIALSYLAISLTLGYLVLRARRDIPLPWMLLAFGLFIVLCGGTHFMEVVTVWIPVYVASAAVKIFAAAASVTTAVILPFTVPEVLTLVQKAKTSEQVTEKLRSSEARKEALLREMHHRVKNNLAVICSLFYLQSSQTKDAQTVRVFRDMERRVHSMALVHESLYDAENVACIDFAMYARTLAEDVLSSHRGLSAPVRMHIRLEPVLMTTDLAVLCGLILNELISNAFKHGFPEHRSGEIKLVLRNTPDGQCSLLVEDDGIGIPEDLDLKASKSLGMRLVRSLTKQIGGTFDLSRLEPGTSAHLQFRVIQHEQ